MKPSGTAYWIKNTHIFQRDEYVCSNCGARFVRPSKFCKECGCRMTGTKSDVGWVDEMEAFDAIFDD